LEARQRPISRDNNIGLDPLSMGLMVALIFIKKTLVKLFTMWQFFPAFNRTVGMTESVSLEIQSDFDCEAIY
jgi:hypothetical protein